MSQRVGSHNNSVYKLVLTGGPYGGKTTGQARLSTFFESIGWKVFRVPETRSLISGGGVKTADSLLGDKTVITYYANVLKTMMLFEKTYNDLAATSKENCLIICDGGMMDVQAHVTSDQWREIMTSNGWNDVELRDSRYNQVVHMVSIADASTGRRRHFSRHDDMSLETGRRLDSAISQAWIGHPYYDVIDNSTDFDRKLVRMIAAVCDRLDIQYGDRLSTDSYKRKFLVTSLPCPEAFPAFQDFIVVHDYLVTPNQRTQARIRRRGQNELEQVIIPMPNCCVLLLGTPQIFIHGTDADLNNWTYTHTIRCPHICSQDSPELKMQVTAREYELLLAQKDSNHCTVYKTRRCFLWNNHYFQLDIYEEPCPQRCRNLMLLETYTSNRTKNFDVPPFLEVEREVTGDLEYSMYNLSKVEVGRRPSLVQPQQSTVVQPSLNAGSQSDDMSTTDWSEDLETLEKPVKNGFSHRHPSFDGNAMMGLEADYSLPWKRFTVDSESRNLEDLISRDLHLTVDPDQQSKVIEQALSRRLENGDVMNKPDTIDGTIDEICYAENAAGDIFNHQQHVAVSQFS